MSCLVVLRPNEMDEIVVEAEFGRDADLDWRQVRGGKKPDEMDNTTDSAKVLFFFSPCEGGL